MSVKITEHNIQSVLDAYSMEHPEWVISEFLNNIPLELLLKDPTLKDSQGNAASLSEILKGYLPNTPAGTLLDNASQIAQIEAGEAATRQKMEETQKNILHPPQSLEKLLNALTQYGKACGRKSFFVDDNFWEFAKKLFADLSIKKPHVPFSIGTHPTAKPPQEERKTNKEKHYTSHK